jgi:hypothetical protein
MVNLMPTNEPRWLCISRLSSLTASRSLATALRIRNVQSRLAVWYSSLVMFFSVKLFSTELIPWLLVIFY